MNNPTEVDLLARFAKKAGFDELSKATCEQIKLRCLDSLAVGIPAIKYSVPLSLRDFVQKTGAFEGSRLIGGGTASLAHAAFYHSALVRYLDFNDSVLTKGETFHPSDVIGGCLAFSDYVDASGKDLIAAIALSYQVQTTLSEVAPVRAKGFDHTVQLGYGTAAALSKLLNLSEDKIANAIAITGTTGNALRVTRTGKLSHWKGLAGPYAVFNAANCVLLAQAGITGPSEIFEGNKGFKETISGSFTVDWEKEKPDLSAVEKSVVKKYNAEIHSQSTIEGILDLKAKQNVDPARIETIRIEIFDVAFNIIGGGEEGEKYTVRTKEEADHSLPYLVAVALLDDGVMPAQFETSRITAADVQSLLRKITIVPSAEFSRHFPEEMPVEIQVTMTDGKTYEIRKHDYEGFTTCPMSWESVVKKFERLTETMLNPRERARIIERVSQLEKIRTRELMDILIF